MGENIFKSTVDGNTAGENATSTKKEKKDLQMREDPICIKVHSPWLAHYRMMYSQDLCFDNTIIFFYISTLILLSTTTTTTTTTTN